MLWCITLYKITEIVRTLWLPSSAETWKIFTNMLCQLFVAQVDILSEKNRYFGKYLFRKTRTDNACKTSSTILQTGKNFSFNQCHEKEFCVFFWGKFINAIENFFPVFVLQTLNFVLSFHNCLEFSQPLLCLYWAIQTQKIFSIA